MRKFNSFSRLFQLYTYFLWVTLPTGNVEIKYSELLQNPISWVSFMRQIGLSYRYLNSSAFHISDKLKVIRSFQCKDFL